jgi:hypothetical protein
MTVGRLCRPVSKVTRFDPLSPTVPLPFGNSNWRLKLLNTSILQPDCDWIYIDCWLHVYCATFLDFVVTYWRAQNSARLHVTIHSGGFFELQCSITHQPSVVLMFVTSYMTGFLLTPWCRILFEKLNVTHLFKKIPLSYGTRRFVTVFTKARHWTLSWVSWIQFAPSNPTSLTSVLMLSSHLFFWINL